MTEDYISYDLVRIVAYEETSPKAIGVVVALVGGYEFHWAPLVEASVDPEVLGEASALMAQGAAMITDSFDVAAGRGDD